jgi:hypothetical protein
MRVRGGFPGREHGSVASRFEPHHEILDLIKAEEVIDQRGATVNLFCKPCQHIPYFSQIEFVIRKPNFCGTHLLYTHVGI